MQKVFLGVGDCHVLLFMSSKCIFFPLQLRPLLFLFANDPVYLKGIKKRSVIKETIVHKLKLNSLVYS